MLFYFIIVSFFRRFRKKFHRASLEMFFSSCFYFYLFDICVSSEKLCMANANLLAADSLDGLSL